MRNKGFLLFFNALIIICVLGIISVSAVLFYNYHGGDFAVIWANPVAVIILAQNAVFVILAAVMLVFVAAQKKENRVPAVQAAAPAPAPGVPDVSRLVMLDKSGGVRAECDLKNARSLIVGKDEHSDAFLKFAAADGSVRHEYAVLNLEKKYWYIESVSELRNVGIRKDYDYLFRRLKSGKLYLLEPGDALEIAGEKIVVK